MLKKKSFLHSSIGQLSTVFSRAITPNPRTPTTSNVVAAAFNPHDWTSTATTPRVVGPFRISYGFLKIEGAGLIMTNSKNLCSLSTYKCWNCGAEAEDTTPFLFCEACRSVQPVSDSIDYFQIFGLRREYNIQVGELEKKYKDWQKKLHPDLVHTKSQREREYAAEQSARVIDAYRTLTDPLLRAVYMVKLEGVLVDEEERITDMDLLAEVMQLREAVDEAKDNQTLKDIQSQLQEKLRLSTNSFKEAYSSKNYEDAVDIIRRMTYYKRANEEIVKKL